MRTFDAVVVGAGTFGAWTAWHLRRAGLSVALVDAYGPANSRASSGGESRLIRMGYGSDELYTRWSLKSLAAWKALSQRMSPPIFHPVGVLWMGRSEDAYMESTLTALHREGIANESLEEQELSRRYPQIDLGPIAWGILEPESGVLLARRAVQGVVREAVADGVGLLESAVAPPAGQRDLGSVSLSSGEQLSAGLYVFACGPWLGKLFPGLLGERIFPSRQEVFYFGPAPGDDRFRPPAMPAWLDLTEEMYGVPDLETRGFKVAVDRHGAAFDPDSGERVPSAEGLAASRSYVTRRFPALRGAPVLSAEVCQYENTSNGDFLVDRHPGLRNVWFVGGGSGHGFKHGPAMGEHVTALVTKGAPVEPRFALDTKAMVQRRTVH
jgi:monomeric sarcosine oxidase